MEITSIACGSGWQSSMLTILAAEGKIEADYANFADPGAEWPETYEFILNTIIPYCEERDFSFYWLKPNGKYIKREDIYNYYLKRKTLPYRINKSCTVNWKIRPMQRFALENYPEASHHYVHLGYTMDEVHRMKDNPHKMFTNLYWYIENKIWNNQLHKFYEERNLRKPFHSACTFCSGNRKRTWLKLLNLHPELFKQAIKLEENAANGALLHNQEIPLRRIKNNKSQSLVEILNLVDDSSCGSVCFT